MTDNRPDLEFIGYDLGHGETALGRAYGRSMREPEILEYRGEKSFVTAIAKTGKDIKIGADAVNIAAMGKDADVWVKFKARDVRDPTVADPTKLFTKTLFASLTQEKKIRGPGTSQFIVGCPSGWSADDRKDYTGIFKSVGLKSVKIIPESRAALMTALEQGYLNLEAARSTVLIVDIGSSTTDFTYCHDLEAEDVGHNILGSGLLDTIILDINLARQNEREKIETLMARYPHYRPIMEYWCRLAKEQYFNGDDKPVEMIKRLPIDGGVLFEIRIDKKDADYILSAKLDALNGFTWPGAFAFALKETIEMLGGRHPETVLLTGGASRLPLVGPACQKAFPDASVVRGAEPEFAIARGLAWHGRFEHLHANFKRSVAELMADNGPIYRKAKAASSHLGDLISPPLVDAIIESCIVPVFQDWRAGNVKSLDDVEPVLAERLKVWLTSDAAQKVLRPVITEWFAGLQRDIEKETDPLCRDHGLPAMVLSLDDSQHVSRHLEDLTVSAPQVTSLESDTALAGTTVSAILIGVILAKANVFALLFANPIGVVVGGAVGAGSYFFGRKALEGKMRSANVPKVARQVMTDGRIRRAAKGQRGELIRAVAEAWDSAASERFTAELMDTLNQALTERADNRAVLFLI